MTQASPMCTARMGDCRCAGHEGHEWHGAGMHSCSVQGCGALWAGETPFVVRLPMSSARRRLYPVPAVRDDTKGASDDANG
jgi:hypothetical protein